MHAFIFSFLFFLYLYLCFYLFFNSFFHLFVSLSPCLYLYRTIWSRNVRLLFTFERRRMREKRFILLSDGYGWQVVYFMCLICVCESMCIENHHVKKSLISDDHKFTVRPTFVSGHAFCSEWNSLMLIKKTELFIEHLIRIFQCVQHVLHVTKQLEYTQTFVRNVKRSGQVFLSSFSINFFLSCQSVFFSHHILWKKNYS